MFGVILFWIQFITAGILLYHILRCIYIKGKKNNSGYRSEYEKTENDKKLTYPLWVIILFLVIFFIPVLNLITFITYLCYRLIDERGDSYNPYYCKSFFTKKY